MPIELPVLDDKTFAELVQEARTALPGHYPEWTDHTPSDPGIALIELLAWLTEMLLYRTSRISERSIQTFLSILNGASSPGGQQLGLEEAVRATLSTLRERWRAVTPEDYEFLALKEFQLARARCLAERDLSSATPSAIAPGHMSLIVLSGLPQGSPPWNAPPTALLDELSHFFRERRLITTQLHITGPSYVQVAISVKVHIRDDALPGDVREAALAALTRYFDPRQGGRDGKGWPFGRDVPASEIYAVLDATRGVEFVNDVLLTVPSEPESRKVMEGATAVAVRIDPHELPRVEPGSIQLTLLERRGDTWEAIP